MKNSNLLGGVVAFTMFYATVLLTAILVPQVLATHVDVIVLPGMVRDATAATDRERAAPAPVEEAAAQPEVWDRLVDRLVGAPAEGPGDAHAPALDALVPRPGTREARSRRAGPDSGMIRGGRVRIRSLKV